jgi:hypothetical protein
MRSTPEQPNCLISVNISSARPRTHEPSKKPLTGVYCNCEVGLPSVSQEWKANQWFTHSMAQRRRRHRPRRRPRPSTWRPAISAAVKGGIHGNRKALSAPLGAGTRWAERRYQLQNLTKGEFFPPRLGLTAGTVFRGTCGVGACTGEGLLTSPWSSLRSERWRPKPTGTSLASPSGLASAFRKSRLLPVRSRRR